MSGRDGGGTGAPGSSETDETATGTPLARREVLKGLAGAGAVAGGITGAGRTLASDSGRPGRYVVGIDPGSEAAPEAGSQARSAALDGPAESLSVSTLEPSSVGRTDATLDEKLLALGSASETDVRVEYWEEGSAGRSQTPGETLCGPGTWGTTVSGLDPGTTYRYQAVAETGGGSARGEERAFTTAEPPLAVETGDAVAVDERSATLVGEVTETGASETVAASFAYWEMGKERRQETTAEALSEPGAVEADLTDLRQDTAYAFRALANSGTESDAGSTEAFATPVEQVSRPTVDRTAAGDATFSQWGDGYRIRAAGKSPWQRPRDEHGYGAVYGEAAGDVVVQTTLAGLRGEHDLRLAGLVVTNDILGGGGVAGDLLLAVEPAAGVSLVTYDEGRREYETVASAGVPFEAPVDLRLTKGDGEFVAEYRRATDTDWQPVGGVAVPAATATQHAGLFATAGHESNRCVADFTDFRIGEAGVTLLPSARVIPPDVETTLDLVVENAENGIRSYTATIDVPDTDLLTIEEVTVAGDPPHQSIDILPDGSRATIQAGMEGNAHGAGDVRIAEVTVHTGAVGTVPVALPEVVVDDAAAVPYDIAAVEGSELTIAEGLGPPPVVGDDPPRDIDGDGLYRDVDGDGQFTISDVQVFFQHRRDDVVLNNAQYFNFADRDPPDVSLADVQALFQDLLARDPGAAAAVGLDVTDTDGVADLTAADLRRALEE